MEKQYQVLARKYRPQKFSELVGQPALVQTLSNEIKNDKDNYFSNCKEVIKKFIE